MKNLAKHQNKTIRLTRTFEAPRELVFDAWTSPEKIGQWWGPDGFTTTTKDTTTKEMNFLVGGDWIFMMHGPDGTDYLNHIVYTEINNPERISYDHYGHEDEDTPHFKNDCSFEDWGGKTKIDMRMLCPTVKNAMKPPNLVLLKAVINRLVAWKDIYQMFRKLILTG